MVLPKNAENIMGGSRFQRAGVPEGWSKVRDVNKHKKGTNVVYRSRDEEGGA